MLVRERRYDRSGEVLREMLAEEGEVLEAAPGGGRRGLEERERRLRVSGAAQRGRTLSVTMYDTNMSLVPSSSLTASLTCTSVAPASSSSSAASASGTGSSLAGAVVSAGSAGPPALRGAVSHATEPKSSTSCMVGRNERALLPWT